MVKQEGCKEQCTADYRKETETWNKKIIQQALRQRVELKIEQSRWHITLEIEGLFGVR